MLKENKREEITKNIEKREALVEQVADGIWRIGVELPQNPLRELNSYLIKGKENERDLLIDTGFRREECREALFAGLRALGSIQIYRTCIDYYGNDSDIVYDCRKKDNDSDVYQ